MASEVKSGKELSIAIRAVKLSVAHMHLDMLIKISSLGELFTAVVVRAGKGSFACMHAQMVEEVMPLPELFVARTVAVAHCLACAQ